MLSGAAWQIVFCVSGGSKWSLVCPDVLAETLIGVGQLKNHFPSHTPVFDKPMEIMVKKRGLGGRGTLAELQDGKTGPALP